MDYTPLYGIGAGLLRSVLGWAKNSLADGKINDLELRQLGETIVRVGLIGLTATYWPGVDLSGLEVAAVAIGGDLVLNAVKSIKKK